MLQRRVQDLSRLGQIFFKDIGPVRGKNIFIRGRLIPYKIILSLGHNRKEQGQNIIMRLLFASALYAPHESFLHQGQKRTISNFFRGIFIGGHKPLMPHGWTLL